MVIFKNYNNKFKAYLYVLPLGILLISFYVVPIIMSMYFGFTKYNIMAPASFIGLKNYEMLLKDKTLKIAIWNTVKFAIFVVPIQTTLALIIANWVTSWKENKVAKFVKGVIFIPVISSMVLIGIVWRILLNGETSLINQIIGLVGIPAQNFLGNKNLALPTLMAIYIWKNTGYFIVIYISALMDIPKTYYEASQVDGASKLEQFKRITLPILKPTTVMVVFLGIIWSLQVFDLVYTLTGGGPGMATMTIVMHAYNLNFKQFNSGYAMAVANVLFFIIALLSIIQKKLIK